MRFIGEILPGVGQIDRGDWERCLPDEAENYDYYRACERRANAAYLILAAKVMRDGCVVAVAPVFALTYRLDTPFQGRMREVSERLHRLAPSLLSFKVLALGSPLAERCHLGFSPELDGGERRLALMAMLDALDQHAKSIGAGLLALKDIGETDTGQFADPLRDAGYAKVNSLPHAITDLPATEEAYIASLSTNTRSSFRRKLKSAKKLNVEYRRNVDDLDDELMSLYEETRMQSGLDYGELERLPPGYFADVLRNLNGSDPHQDRAGILLFWLDATLIGFNLLLYERRKVIDKFIGRRYPVSKDYHLFFVGWMENVRIALARGAGQLQSGQTHYEVKVRLGSRLSSSYLFFRHRNRAINLLLRLISNFIAFDRLDPDLQALRKADRI